MNDTPTISAVAALLADPTRARMLTALMDGRALTATELALEGGVTPSTTSSHLGLLTRAGLLSVARQGRHRYFRLAAPEVAMALEQLMSLGARDERSVVRTGPRDAGLRRARVCYDHLAGEVAVRLLVRLREAEFVVGGDESLALTRAGEAWCGGLGIDLGVLLAKRRPLCRSCLDWSERRTHLAGALGAALLDYLFVRRHAWRVAGSRAVGFSTRGEAFVERPDLLG